MPFLDKLERNFGRFAIPGLSLGLVVGQALVWLALMRGLLSPDLFIFTGRAALAGQWWRLITFLLMPPQIGLLFIAFAWWMFYLMGSALEAFWGAFRYNLFLFVGLLLTVGVGFVYPDRPVSNLFIAGSVFLAFAYLNPGFEILLFFILPVRIKWLALIAWIGYAISFVMGDGPARLQILATVGNFVLFFGPDAWRRAHRHTRQITLATSRAAAARPASVARHQCRICGKTDRTDPQLDFRYCSKCAGEACYCPEHIFNHVHVTEEDEAKNGGKA
jgi:hypothetical protein